MQNKESERKLFENFVIYDVSKWFGLDSLFRFKLEGSLVGFRLRRRSLCESHLVIDNVSINYLMKF